MGLLAMQTEPTCAKEAFVAQSLFEQAGGEHGVHAIIDDFVERIFSDPMIGFFFGKVAKERIKAKEYEFAAGHLGAGVAYTGRPLPHAHSAHPITGGHFMRRLQILKETLLDHAVPSPVIDHWLEHSERMRPFITQQAGSTCDDDATAKPEIKPEASATPATNSTDAMAQTTPKPAPSIDEINAYLERSAAMTKKRLPLAFRAPEAEAVSAAGDSPTPAATSTSTSEPTPDTATADQAPKASRALPLVGKPGR